jgi:hypothetical protein
VNPIKPISAFCIAFVLAGCGFPARPKLVSTQTLPTSEEQPSYSDPFAYCAAVGSIDSPDARYSGSKLPDAIIQGMIQQGFLPAAMPAESQKHTAWRCMDHNVWVCNYGVNIPCLEKADLSQVPTSAMEDYCKMNPTVEGIPAYITGRVTIYSWNCKEGKPGMVGQIMAVDPQGYPSAYWHELAPN